MYTFKGCTLAPHNEEERAYAAWWQIHHKGLGGACQLCAGVRGHVRCPFAEPVKVKMYRCLAAKEKVIDDKGKPESEQVLQRNGYFKKKTDL